MGDRRAPFTEDLAASVWVHNPGCTSELPGELSKCAHSNQGDQNLWKWTPGISHLQSPPLILVIKGQVHGARAWVCPQLNASA